MKPPVRLDLLGKTWEVVIKAEKGKYGSCEHARCRINLSPTQAVSNMRDTLLHEVLHALEYEGQLRMSERQVRGMATLLLAALRQNPALLKFLSHAD